MKIQKNSILNLSEKFRSFEKSLEGCDYVVTFDCVKFDYSDSVEFTIKNLKELYKGENISGDIILYDFKSVINDVKHALSYFSNDEIWDIISSEEKEKIINEREKQFWEIIKLHFKLPPKIVYEHYPNSQSYFGNSIMWGFCFILLNNKHGLVISGSASD